MNADIAGSAVNAGNVERVILTPILLGLLSI